MPVSDPRQHLVRRLNVVRVAYEVRAANQTRIFEYRFGEDVDDEAVAALVAVGDELSAPMFLALVRVLLGEGYSELQPATTDWDGLVFLNEYGEEDLVHDHEERDPSFVQNFLSDATILAALRVLVRDNRFVLQEDMRQLANREYSVVGAHELLQSL